MPNGKTHREITIVGGIVATSATLLLGGDIEAVLGVGLGFMATLALNPDLDLHHKLGFLGDLIGATMYKKLVPHRAGLRINHWRFHRWRLLFFSHVPFIGTLPRFVMALILPLIFALMVAPQSIAQFGQLLLWIYLGMSFSDALHVVADVVVSGYSGISLDSGYKRQRSERDRRSLRRG